MKKNGEHMVTCKKCGKKGLAWKETLEGYKLCDNFNFHNCDKNNLRNKNRKQ